MNNFKKVIRRLIIFLFNIAFKAGLLKMVFIVGHMRSGSSLLTHILISHPNITGYGETHYRYNSKSDFGKAAYKIFRSFQSFSLNKKFIVDKVLHDYLSLNPDLLNSKNMFIIFIIRDPEHSLPSILDLGLDIISDESQALQYYKDRCETIKKIFSLLPHSRFLFITYDLLINETESVLEKIGELLKLNSPLQSHYKLIWSTGKMGIGDPSDTIKAGQIIKHEKKYNHHVSKEILERANKIYDDCKSFCTNLN